MGMETVVQCPFCSKRASNFYLTLDGTLWAVCKGHSGPFVKIAVPLDPDKYDLDDYFEDLAESAED
jgi:hypothetical protein